MAKRNVIRLSESQLNRVIMESVKRCLKENRLFESDYDEDDVDDEDFGKKANAHFGKVKGGTWTSGKGLRYPSSDTPDENDYRNTYLGNACSAEDERKKNRLRNEGRISRRRF